jgi:hypothetical protein
MYCTGQPQPILTGPVTMWIRESLINGRGTCVCEICCSREYFNFMKIRFGLSKSSLHFEQQFQCCLLRFVSKAA